MLANTHTHMHNLSACVKLIYEVSSDYWYNSLSVSPDDCTSFLDIKWGKKSENKSGTLIWGFYINLEINKDLKIEKYIILTQCLLWIATLQIPDGKLMLCSISYILQALLSICLSDTKDKWIWNGHFVMSVVNRLLAVAAWCDNGRVRCRHDVRNVVTQYYATMIWIKCMKWKNENRSIFTSGHFHCWFFFLLAGVDTSFSASFFFV